MKITISQLRQIIREELELNELFGSSKAKMDKAVRAAETPLTGVGMKASAARAGGRATAGASAAPGITPEERSINDKIYAGLMQAAGATNTEVGQIRRWSEKLWDEIQKILNK